MRYEKQATVLFKDVNNPVALDAEALLDARHFVMNAMEKYPNIPWYGGGHSIPADAKQFSERFNFNRTDAIIKLYHESSAISHEMFTSAQRIITVLAVRGNPNTEYDSEYIPNTVNYLGEYAFINPLPVLDNILDAHAFFLYAQERNYLPNPKNVLRSISSLARLKRGKRLRGVTRVLASLLSRQDALVLVLNELSYWRGDNDDDDDDDDKSKITNETELNIQLQSSHSKRNEEALGKWLNPTNYFTLATSNDNDA